MAEASITLKLTPSEFDRVRRSLETEREAQLLVGEHAPEPKQRHEAKAEALLIHDLQGKLN